MLKNRPVVLVFLSVLMITPLFSLALKDIDLPVLNPVESNRQEVSAEATLEMAYSEAIGSDNDAYHFQPSGAGYTTSNPDHNLSVNVTADTLTIAINDNTWQLTSNKAANSFTVEENRLTIHHDGYDEWYVNGPVGLQQGFTLYESSDVSFGVGGTLPTTASNYSLSIGDNLNFVGLMAYDANGENIPVEFAFEDEKLAYVYDDAEITYPLTIDPWLQQQRLTGIDEGIRGAIVALDGDTALVGNPSESCAAGSACGSVHVFTRSSSVWNHQTTLTADDADRYDSFGNSVALDGDTALVGAYGDDCPDGFDCGSAYVFTGSGSTWTQQQKLTVSDLSEYNEFGVAVALDRDTALIGAYSDGCVIGGTHCGGAYVFTRSSGIWGQQQKLTAPDNTDLGFGISVALDGDTASIGAFWEACASEEWCGIAFVFTRSGTTWSQQARLTDSSAYAGERVPVTVDGDTVLLGAEVANCAAGERCGSVYVFMRSGTTWSQQAKLTASDAADFDLFGSAVSLQGDTALIGAYLDDCSDGPDCGSAYVFTRSGVTWSQQDKLVHSDINRYWDFFGGAVALDGNTALIGAINIDSSYLFYYDPSGPTPSPTNTPTNTPTATPTFTPSDTPTDTPTATDTWTPTMTNTPTNTPTPVALVASATCVDENLAVTISAGDDPFIIRATAGINMPVGGVGIGTTTINGPEKWDNVVVKEPGGDRESIYLGTFRCRTDERPMPVSPAHQSHTTNPFPTFSWAGISIANNYRVWVFDDAVVANRMVDIRENSGGPTMMTLTTPLPDGRLFWRVRGRQNRVWSLWSIRYTLFKDPVVPLTVPTPAPTIDLNGASTVEPQPTVVPPTFPAPPNSR